MRRRSHNDTEGAGLPEVLQDTQTQSGVSTTTKYVYGLGLLAKTDASNNTSYFLTDGLGSTVDLRDGSGGEIESYTYDEWGNPVTAPSQCSNTFRYTGQQQDCNANRGLYYLRARFYDPSLGRFLSKDPVPFLQRYAYAIDNPMNFIDPLGLCGFGPSAVCSGISALGNAVRFTDNLPETVPAIAWGLANGGDCSIDSDLFVVCSNMSGGYGRAGTTVGNVFLTGLTDRQLRQRPELLQHEKRHATQWAWLGPFIPVLYGINEGIGNLLPGPSYCWNVFEWDAGFKKGGYACSGFGQASDGKP